VDRQRLGIGTLSEKTVHAIFKDYYEPDEDHQEIPIENYVADIYKTQMCPLAKVMRRELKKRGVKKLKVVYSTEPARKPLEDMESSCRNHCICPPGAVHKCTERRAIPGSVAFVPSVAGLIIAGEVVKDIVGSRV